MTSSLFRGRSRRAKAHIRVRVTHAVLGALVGAGWLMLPLMTVATRRPVPATAPGTLADAAAPGQGGTSAADYVLPLIAVAAASVLAAYGYLRRVRRTRTRTTPGTTLRGGTAPPTIADAERQARIALVLADDCVRTSREELGFVRERFGVGKAGGWAREGWGEKAEAGPPTADGMRTGAIPATGAAADTGAGSGAGAAHGGFEAETGAAGAGAAGARFKARTDADRRTRQETVAEAGTQVAARARAAKAQFAAGTDPDRRTRQEIEAEPSKQVTARARAAQAQFETGTDPDRPTPQETEAEPGTQVAARAGAAKAQFETGTDETEAEPSAGREVRAGAAEAQFAAGADAGRRTPQETGAEGGARAGAVPGAASVGGALGDPPSETETQHRATAEVEAETATAAFVHALRGAETELVAAFAMWRRYERGLPGEAGARRQALVGVVGRCAEAGRRLDAEAAALDQVRGLEGPGAGMALDVAEGRFRALAARTVAAHATLAALRERYAPSATDPVTGSVEQAKDRLLFATAHLNATRRSIDAADGDGTARNLRAAEGAVAQAEILVTGVERLAARLREAAALVPAALTGAEAELTAARHGRSRASLATGELNARLAHADSVLAAVREELTGALPYDPLDALRRITRAVDRLDVGRSGVLDTAALLVARTSLESADDFVTVHRGAVGPEARALLSEAARTPAAGTRTAFETDTAARAARGLAERDVRAHGTPYPDTTTIGLPGAVLGGILLAEDPDGGPPATFGGPATRGRRHVRAPG
ncbi:hypothetical protein HEP81_02928 [Streptomyces griseofuscus]|uniref:Uncharacterized protein n=1 Tax=Streptomyces griseofuscus TaxID=146922 RepID=A0A7H1PYW2_9ACTN|nr:hypothetical protein [Streptomyces griseofuscus]QNT93242.1 hypothetical protein HEP81_02928 [Streptomyces griseofuscus]